MQEHIWIAKALAQSAICRLRLLSAYHAGQRKLGRLKAFHPLSRIEYAAKLYTDIGGPENIKGATIVEVGTGWVPVVPLALHLMGAARIVTYDLNRHLQPGLTMRCVPMLAECFSDLHRRTGMDLEPLRKRLQLLLPARSIGELFDSAGIEYLAPSDASQTGLPASSVDLFYSNLVLEHIPTSSLRAIHNESTRVLKPSGVAWHNIDFSDHYAATHASLSDINFLRYAPGFWDAFGNNEILYQNRLRRGQHVALMEGCGLCVERCVEHVSGSAARALAGGQAIHADFASLPEAELLTTSARVVARRSIDFRTQKNPAQH